MHTRPRLAALLAPVLVLAALAGCGGGGSPTDSQPAAVSSTVPSEGEAAFPRTVQHAMGATEVPTEPERVVTLDMSFVDAALTLGVPILGYTEIAASEDGLPGYFGSARDALAADAVALGTLAAPNLEAVAAARPDLILTSKVRHEALYDELSAIAPTVMSESAGAGWKDNIRLTGEATGREDETERVLADYQARAAAVGRAVNAAAGSPTVSVVRFVEPIRLYQRGSFSGVVLDDAGLARPENQTNLEPFVTEISPEQLDQADADVIFFTYYTGVEDETAQRLAGNGLWQGLGAVRRGDAHLVPDETWMSAVGMFGAHAILDDLAETFGVDPAR